MQEKRRAPRVKEQTAVSIAMIAPDQAAPGRRVTYHLSEDVSARGARIQTNAILPVGTLLRIQLTVQDPPRMIVAVGRVRWVRSFRSSDSFEAGIEFMDTDRDDIRFLAQHVARARQRALRGAGGGRGGARPCVARRGAPAGVKRR